MKNNFSSNLKKLLKLKGANQQKLGNFVGVRQTSVSNWINGVSSPDVDNLLKIYQYFGLKNLNALVLENMETGKVEFDERIDKDISSIEELLAAKDRIIRLQDEKIAVLEAQLNMHNPPVEVPKKRYGA